MASGPIGLTAVGTVDVIALDRSWHKRRLVPVTLKLPSVSIWRLTD